jgi:hypothetical protein
MASRLWKVNCSDEEFPGMWQRWLKHQCVGIGWPPMWGFHLTGKTKGKYGWSRARRLIPEIQPGDYVIASLRGHRVGRLGEVTGKAVEDKDWKPLVPPSRDYPDGQMGRRIFVRWDLNVGPDDREMVVTLPPGVRLSPGELRPTIAEVRSQTLRQIEQAMCDPQNWTPLVQFAYERALSEYISANPHRLEDGLLPHPNKKVRERIFADRKRLDVLLLDRNKCSVIVECKQNHPTVGDVIQLQHYLKRFWEEEKQRARGILVHGGARKLRSDVEQAANREPVVELVQYQVQVDFSASR